MLKYVVEIFVIHIVQFFIQLIKGAQWRSGRASDSKSRGPEFDPHKRHRGVSLSKTH